MTDCNNYRVNKLFFSSIILTLLSEFPNILYRRHDATYSNIKMYCLFYKYGPNVALYRIFLPFRADLGEIAERCHSSLFHVFLLSKQSASDHLADTHFLLECFLNNRVKPPS